MDALFLSLMNMSAGHFSSLAGVFKIAVMTHMLRLHLKATGYSLRLHHGQIKKA